MVTRKIKKDIFSHPRYFSEAYIRYLRGESLISAQDKEVIFNPRIIPLASTYRSVLTLTSNKKVLQNESAEIEKQLPADTQNEIIEHNKQLLASIDDPTLSFQNELIEIEKLLPAEIKAIINTFKGEIKRQLLVALYDLTILVMLEHMDLKKRIKEGNKERGRSITAVKNLLALPILGPDDVKALTRIEQTLMTLDKEVSYSPEFVMKLYLLQGIPNAKDYLPSGALLFDHYIVTHQNVKFRATKLVEFFKTVLLVTINFLVREAGVSNHIATTERIVVAYFESRKPDRLPPISYKMVDSSSRLLPSPLPQ